ncbi:MAG TPA: hypothetical protein VL992_03030, partial [Tepidisphaeraceae bacterium]|nr:hypothetical protein [Tepidisphaeraceae bacterium]
MGLPAVGTALIPRGVWRGLFGEKKDRLNLQLIWLEALAALLLWLATFAACAGHARRPWAKVIFWLIAWLVPLAELAPFILTATALKFGLAAERNRFAYCLALLCSFLIGAAAITYRAGRPRVGLASAAGAWPRGLLALAWLAAAAVGHLTLYDTDLTLRTRCAVLGAREQCVYLAAMPAITAHAENAAPLYDQALARLDDDPPTDINSPPIGSSETFDPAEPAVISFLRRQAGTIALLRRAAALPACRFDRDLQDPVDFDALAALIPDLSRERQAANVIRMDEEEALAHGDISTAVADVNAIYGMSRHFGFRPLAVSALYGFGIDEVANAALQETLPSVKHRNELNALRLDQLPSPGYIFQQALRSEEMFGL